MRLFSFFIIVGLLLQLDATLCHAQYYFKHYQADDGLVHNSVTCVIQDHKGLMWIGTRGGLSSFDGYTFKTIKNKGNKFGNIGNNLITSIAEDKAGMLWIGTGKGVFRYDPYQETLNVLAIGPQKYISQLLVDNQNNLWFLANFDLYKYNRETNRVEDLKIQASCLTIDQRNNLWIGNDDGVVGIYNARSRSVSGVRIVSQQVPANLRSISKIFPVNDDELLIGCFKQGLKSYHPKTGKISSLPLRNKNNTDIYVRDIAAGNNQEYWIATESGIYIYDLANNTGLNLHKRTGDPYSLSDNAVYTICRDRDGGMWAGTFFGGVSYYSEENARFEKYYQLPGINSISGDAVREICSDNKGHLWIGTEDAGINKLDLKTGQFTNYTATGKSGDISYPNVHGLLAVGNQLFIGPFLHGMEIMDIRTGKITDHFRFIGDKKDKTSDFVLHISLTRDSTLLVGTAYNGSGLFIYDRQHKTFKRIKEIPYNSYVFDIKEDSQGNIWTGSVTQGAFFYNPKTGKSGNIRFGDKVGKKIINEFAVHGILEDSNHAIWFATEGGGLIKLSPDHKVIKKFTTENGLPSNVVYCILEDNSKHLWISSLKGLICLNLRTEQTKTFTQSNGLITDQFNYNSAYKDITGKMYFGSVKGMIAFNPDEFDKEDIYPPTYITGFEISNKEITPGEEGGPLRKSILYTDTITLKHYQNNFSIEFAALNYSSPKVTRYKYLMRGLDKDWTYLNSNRNAYFTDLSPGKYTFIVQAESNVGSWVGHERRLFIQILPPIWKSYTAYIIYILLIFIVLYLSVRYYHRYLERKNANRLRLFEHEKEKEIYEAKIEFFTNIAHEIQTPLTLIIGPLEWIMKKVEDLPSVKKSLILINKHAQRLADLTDQLLDFRKTEIDQYGLNFVNTDISQVLQDQLEVFREEAGKNHINLTAKWPKMRVVAYVDKEAFVKICVNLLSNAIKYASTMAFISLEPINSKSEFFTVRFCNDGKSIPDHARDMIFEPFYRVKGTEKPGTGIGLPLAKSLADLHGGTLSLLKDTDLIIFELTLPIHQKFEFKLGTWKNPN